MKAVLFGASKGMGRALARLLAARGDRLFLLEHVTEELKLSARDLEIHGAPGPVRTAYCSPQYKAIKRLNPAAKIITEPVS